MKPNKSARIITSRIALLSFLLTTGHVNSYATPGPSSSQQKFVFQSDTQYPRSRASSDDPEESLRLINEQNSVITTYRTAHGGPGAVPIILNGDVTEYGHHDEWKIVKGRMLPGTFYGLGNHDYENNVDDCFTNNCAIRSVVESLTEDIKHWNVDAFDQHQEGDQDPTWQTYNGSMAYSKTFGEFTFIQLNNHYAYQNSWSGRYNLENKTVNIRPSLDWLETQLERANQNGKLIIINMHRNPNADPDWGNESERARFRDMINKHKVLAIFHGHTHTLANRGKVGEVPVLDSGSPINKTFMVGESDLQKNTFIVKQAKDNVLLDKAYLTIPIKSHIPEPDILAWPMSLDFSLPLRHRRERDFASFEVSIDGGAYVRSDANKKVTIGSLTPSRRYEYRIRVYDEGNANPVKTFSGTATTAHQLLAPKELCYVSLGEPGAPRNDFTVQWKPPYNGYGPGNYWFRVALYSLDGTLNKELRGAAQGSRSLQIRFSEPEDFWNKALHVRYQSAGLPDGPDAKFELKNVFQGCGIQTNDSVQPVR